MYPLISLLAKAYLTIPATSVPSECVFFFFYSRGYCECTKIPENVGMLVFLQKYP